MHAHAAPWGVCTLKPRMAWVPLPPLLPRHPGSGQALAASGAVGMAAALDEELNLKEQV